MSVTPPIPDPAERLFPGEPDRVEEPVDPEVYRSLHRKPLARAHLLADGTASLWLTEYEAEPMPLACQDIEEAMDQIAMLVHREVVLRVERSVRLVVTFPDGEEQHCVVHSREREHELRELAGPPVFPDDPPAGSVRAQRRGAPSREARTSTWMLVCGVVASVLIAVAVAVLALGGSSDDRSSSSRAPTRADSAVRRDPGLLSAAGQRESKRAVAETQAREKLDRSRAAAKREAARRRRDARTRRRAALAPRVAVTSPTASPSSSQAAAPVAQPTTTAVAPATSPSPAPTPTPSPSSGSSTSSSSSSDGGSSGGFCPYSPC